MTTIPRPAAAVPHEVLPRLLPRTPLDLAAHTARYGPRAGTGALSAVLAEAGLTGRGGAAFPVHRKIDSVAAAARRSGRAPVVVANGCEGEPASHKDATLLRLAPHLVLDGLLTAADAIGARTAHLAVERGSGLLPGLRAALSERPGDRVSLAEVPRRFISGESSALTGYLSGGNGLPRFPQPPTRERGVGGAPTLVQNVETLAQLALIARYGPGWFRTAGTSAEPGSMLCTVHTAGTAPRVFEASAGTPLRRLFGPLPYPVQAVLVGGYHGSWLPAAALERRLAAADLGVPLGAGVLAALPADRCGLVETARVLRYLALESAGQCGPCLNGLPRIAAAFADLADPSRAAWAPGLLDDLARWSGLVEGRGVCHHPDGTVRLVRSALTVFAAEAYAHQSGHCTAGNPTAVLPVPSETAPEALR
ncbi:NADH-ubiquinone oxidoreductase-F iron-sulfur binding region domain-containing protein [Streptacidiphilus carbonis]|uniref:NADH-ubiquinone oxidoreductase-F iron-sulfur binding region domain-containing protein n=1 Tax=Streptacidiphilus carbonis TaxID=105422 RepID=UPI0005A8EBEC|nr:NADH-ubiquinone oxidoreductase-F iron-sulfur binding region domain-containing protein [Streptacidiphilus carbonis]